MNDSVFIDFGSFETKFGNCNSDQPSKNRSVVSRVLYPTVIPFPNMKDSYIGEEGIALRSVVQNNNFIKRGNVTNWRDYENMVHHIFYYQLQIVPEETNVSVNQNFQCSFANSAMYTQIMFETFGVPNFSLIPSALSTMFYTGINTGVNVDIGHGTTKIVPIINGQLQVSAGKRIELSGIDLDRQLGKVINEASFFDKALNYTQASKDYLVSKMKKKVCHVSLDFEKELFGMQQKYITKEGTKYHLPNGKIFDIGQKSFSLCEIFFQPNLFEIDSKPLPKLIVDSILSATDDINIIDNLFSNIVLTGGTSLIPNFKTRLKKEMDLLLEDYQSKIISFPNAQQICWLGGKKMINHPGFSNFWISKAEYEEEGSNIIHKELYKPKFETEQWKSEKKVLFSQKEKKEKNKNKKKLEEKEEEEEEEVNYITIDFGSLYTKIGLNNENKPKLIVPTLYFENKNKMNPMPIFGNEIFEDNLNENELKQIFKNREITDYESFSGFVEYLFDQLGIEIQKSVINFVFHCSRNINTTEKVLQCFCDEKMCLGFYFTPAPIANLFCKACFTGIIVEIGDKYTEISAFSNGFFLNGKKTILLDLGGNDITKYLALLIGKNNKKVKFNTLKNYLTITRIIKEKYCFVNFNEYQEEKENEVEKEENEKEKEIEKERKENEKEREKEGGYIGKLAMEYQLPNKQKIEIENERYLCTEILFSPEIIGKYHDGIHQIISNLIKSCDICIQKDLMNSIVLAGGTSQFKGLKKRLSFEINKIIGSNQEANVKVSQNPQYSAWLGATKLTRLPSFYNLVQSAEDYSQCGQSSYGQKFIY
ncbi:actin-5c-related [Anaeramoeba flamelloides]|uniref:Actin-5c-related n=1 Tax=Anaeramoeba flamelloides TaxID=1746091 RepID=A0ABQ8ZDS3_9EUKA|nr:actin-5c-related [Anaeramoeba flamelloides]